MKRLSARSIVLVLHNIRSAHNVGAILRTADAVGVEEVVLSGYTPTPRDVHGLWRNDVAKTALGAERSVPWRCVPRLSPELTRLSERGYCVLGVEQDERSVPYTTLRPIPRRAALILGNEVRGLSRPLRALCDVLVHIPMRGAKESLNVSVAAGVVLYGLYGSDLQ